MWLCMFYTVVYLLEIPLVLVEVEQWSNEHSVVVLPRPGGCFSPTLIQLILSLEEALSNDITLL